MMCEKTVYIRTWSSRRNVETADVLSDALPMHPLNINVKGYIHELVSTYLKFWSFQSPFCRWLKLL